MKKIFLLIVLPIAIFWGCKKDTAFKNASNEKPDSVTAIEEESVYSIIGVGDIMMGSNYPSTSSLPPNDGEYLFESVKEILSDADVTCGNLEGVLLDKGGTPKVCRDSGGHCYSFRMPEHYAGYLKDAGFDFMNIANNHSGDMGIKGRERTTEVLDEYEIYYAGSKDYPTTIIERNGIKFGFAGFAPNNGCSDLLNLEKAAEIISNLKKESDIVIVSFHGGAEGTSSQHVTGKDEYFLGEDRGNVLEFAHNAIDAGADIVFGHGPHVTRAVELYKNRLIAYSLGNFCTYAKINTSGVLGLAPILKVYVNKSGEFLKGEIFPAKQIKRGIPIIDDDAKVIKIIQSLTNLDFPGTKLDISEEGHVLIKN